MHTMLIENLKKNFFKIILNFFKKGVPVVMTNVTSLPIRLIVKPCAPIKDADYKVTLSTNKPAVSLLDLFPGM